MFKIPKLLSVLLTTLALAGFAAAPAVASHGQVNFFDGGEALIEPATRAQTLKTLEGLGVHAIRVELYWAELSPEPESATTPAVNLESPSSYNWEPYASLLSEAAAKHWKVLLTVTSPAPRWATSNHKAPYVTRPDSLDFQRFMAAVGKQFGSEVYAYGIWNEPNHPAFLLPQWTSKGTPASPRIYRSLYQAAYTGLKAGGVAHPRTLFGETAPTGVDGVSRKEGEKATHPVAPLKFLREALCLNNSYKKAGTCSELPMSGYGHHAYTLPAGPFYKDPEKDSVMLGDLSRLSAALQKAARAHAIPSHVPLYLTEFGVQSFPNRFLGVSASKQAEYDAIAERIAYENPSVAAFSQYLLVDDPVGGAPGSSVRGGTIGFQTGLEYVNGAKKPLFAGWPVPLTVTKARHGVKLWGLVRPTTAATTVTILVRAKGSTKYKQLATAHTNSAGYWTLSSTKPGQYWRVRWVDPTTKQVYEGPAIAEYK